MSNSFELLKNINQKGGNTGLNIVIFIIILLILSGIGYYAYSSMHKYTPPPGPPPKPPGPPPKPPGPTPTPPETPSSGNWEMDPGNCIRGCINNIDKFGNCPNNSPNNISYNNFSDAQTKCIANNDCDGVYQDPTNNQFFLRRYCGKDPNAIKYGGFFCGKTKPEFEKNSKFTSCNTGQGGKSYFKPGRK